LYRILRRGEIKVKKFISSLLVTGSLLMVGSVVSAHGETEDTHVKSSAVNKQLAEVRQATAKYHDINVALANGYINTYEFAYVPELGGMGIHFVNLPLMNDEEVNATEPEVLLYAPQKNGDYKLIGVEYYMPAAVATKQPTLFGRNFDGPMLNHELEPMEHELTDDEKNDPQNQHYDLHAWIWKANPNGMFTPFNPNIKPLE
jgi:hypothetical protein